MKNNWSNSEATKYIRKYKGHGHSKDMALRVYTTRLLGRNSELVLHGGGNTSVKTSIKDIDGRNYKVLCVKGSGWDMADIEPPGLPAVKLEPLLALKNKKYLVVGNGNMARHISSYFDLLDIPYHSWWRSSGENINNKLLSSEKVLVAISDDAIIKFTSSLLKKFPRKIFIHFSKSFSLVILS